MTSVSALFGLALVGTVFWPANPEAALVLLASRSGVHPLVLGAVAAGGQAVTLTLLFLFGGALRRRWRWFDGKCERVGARFGDRIARHAIVGTSASALFGVPPISVVATLAPALTERAARLLPLMIALRVVRFSVVAAIAASIWRP